jgi:hypothetical protein
MTSTPRTEAGMGERARAVTVAAWMLDRPNADPDDDLAILSRQFLRCIDRATSDGEWTTERQPGDDEECERLGCEDRTHPVHHRAATPPALDRETLRDGYSLSFDEEYGWIVLTDPEGASQIVATSTRPQWGLLFDALWPPATPLTENQEDPR